MNTTPRQGKDGGHPGNRGLRREGTAIWLGKAFAFTSGWAAALLLVAGAAPRRAG